MLRIDPLTKNLYLEYINSNLYKEMSNFSKEFSKNKKSFFYDKIWIKDSFSHFSRKAEYQFVFNELKNDSKMLDAGCGITFFPSFIKNKFPNLDLDLVDFSRQAEKFYRNRDFSFISSDLTNLNILDKQYDIVYCISTLEHIKNYSSVIKEFHRVLKPKGKLILTFDVSHDKDGFINTENLNIFINSIISTFQKKDKDYSFSKEGLITSHDFEKRDLPWKYPKIIYKYYYKLTKKRNISAWPPKISIVMMSITKNL